MARNIPQHFDIHDYNPEPHPYTLKPYPPLIVNPATVRPGYICVCKDSAVAKARAVLRCIYNTYTYVCRPESVGP